MRSGFIVSYRWYLLGWLHMWVWTPDRQIQAMTKKNVKLGVVDDDMGLLRSISTEVPYQYTWTQSCRTNSKTALPPVNLSRKICRVSIDSNSAQCHWWLFSLSIAKGFGHPTAIDNAPTGRDLYRSAPVYQDAPDDPPEPMETLKNPGSAGTESQVGAAGATGTLEIVRDAPVCRDFSVCA